jgi:HAMP domain-containing protein
MGIVGATHVDGAAIVGGGDGWLAWFDSVQMGNHRAVVAARVAPERLRHRRGLAGERVIGLIFLVAFGITLAFAQWGARRISGSLRELAAASERIGNLDLDRPVEVEARSAEMQDLVHSQERMRLALLGATRNLEQKVEERTGELAEREAFSRVLMESSTAGPDPQHARRRGAARDSAPDSHHGLRGRRDAPAAHRGALRRRERPRTLRRGARRRRPGAQLRMPPAQEGRRRVLGRCSTRPTSTSAASA